jgi:site-specific recombinase XerD
MFIGKKKNGIYFIDFFDPNGNRNRRISTGTKIKSEAQKFLAQFAQRIFNDNPKSSKTLTEFQNEYVDNVARNLSPNYTKSILLSFSQLANNLGDVKISSITTLSIQSFLTAVYTKSPHAAELYYRTLKAAFTKAVDWEFLNSNPFKKIKLPKPQKKFPLFITEQQLNVLLAQTNDNLMSDIIIVAFYSGMRLAEILNMKWSHVSFTDKLVVVKNNETFTTKSKKDRIIPMCDRLFSTLINRYELLVDKNATEYVFEKFRGVKYLNDHISKSFKKILKKTTLDQKLKFHSLRHSFASNLIQKGVSIYVMKELLGHCDISVTQIYSHLQSENLIKAVHLFDY